MAFLKAVQVTVIFSRVPSVPASGKVDSLIRSQCLKDHLALISVPGKPLPLSYCCISKFK